MCIALLTGNAKFKQTEPIKDETWRNDRIYKSLSFDDFMETASFIFAKGGWYAMDLIQDTNYYRTLPSMQNLSNQEWQTSFMQRAKNIIRQTPDINIIIKEMDTYWDIWTKLKA